MKLTVVMYHFVRDIARSRFKDIKGLETDLFKGQIEFIKKHYSVVSCYDVISFLKGEAKLPPRPLILSFDDGYIDHFENVFPVLLQNKLPGCFFPAAEAVLKKKVLGVNKIHFVLASCKDKQSLLLEIEGMFEVSKRELSLGSIEQYKFKEVPLGRQDDLIVTNIKQMLQRSLPYQLRSTIVNFLFEKYVTTDEQDFANNLYMDEVKLRRIMEGGMILGSHGYSHEWMDIMPAHEQEREVELSLNFLRDIGVSMEDWVMCYPHGAWNESLLKILRKKGCGLGLTIEVNLAKLGKIDPLLMPRLDTNDLPKSHDASASSWTVDAN